MKLGFPVMVSDFFIAVADSVVMMIIGRMGAAFVAANAVAAVVMNMASILIQELDRPLDHYRKYFGEGRVEEALKQGYAFLGLGIGIGFVMSVLILILSEEIILAYQLSANTALG